MIVENLVAFTHEFCCFFLGLLIASLCCDLENFMKSVIKIAKNLDFVIKTDDSAFISVFNPHAAGSSKPSASKAKIEADEDLPF